MRLDSATTGGRAGAAGGQTPGLFHLPVLHARHGFHLMAAGRHQGAGQDARVRRVRQRRRRAPLMLARKRMTGPNFSSPAGTRWSFWPPNPRPAKRTRRGVIDVLTKSAPVLVFPDGWWETNNYAGNCPGGRGSCRGRSRLDCGAAFGVGGVVICVGFGTQAHGGICWAFAVRQLPPQGIG